jgi:hypothetical protein
MSADQQQINYGSEPNDGNGDPLRTAFIKTDDNFDAIWAAGPVGSNVTIVNNTVSVTSPNADLVLKPNGLGVIQANASILPNTANIRDLGSAGQRWRSAWVGVGGANITGNVEAAYFVGNGAFLTGISASSNYGNANVAAFLPTYTGNISAGAVLTSIIESTDSSLVTIRDGVEVKGSVLVDGNLTVSGTAGNVVTKHQGSWSVPAGNSTQSFTVDSNHTYQMWVEGNIPNGIIAWNATVTVTNTNVPVLGQQFAWNYEGGGNVLMFNTIPAQIIGTAGAISNVEPAVANTNVFSFGINNASGNTITVEYGWVKIS